MKSIVRTVEQWIIEPKPMAVAVAKALGVRPPRKLVHKVYRRGGARMASSFGKEKA